MTNPASFFANRRQFMDGVAAALALAAAPTAAFAQAPLRAMKIATIGAGREGGALGTAFAKLGHPVMFSSRHPEELKDLVAAAGPTARAGTTAEAVAFGEVIFLVVPYPAIEQIAQEFGAALAAKPLILDVSNPIPGRDGQDFVNKITAEGGPGVVTAQLLKGAKIVRGFNAISFKLVSGEQPPTGPVGVPIAGDDAKAIALASRLIREVGFEPVLIGDLTKGKYLVPGTPVGGAHTPDELRSLAATLGG
jgi:8-hydroxy-5-deazaflavin:NADPH oxidoreductase